MKHYTTIFYCLVLSALLIFVPNAQAASVSLNVIMPSYIRLNLTNQYYPQYDSTDNPLGNKAIYTYEGDLTISVSGLSVDSYNSGLFRLNFSPSVNTPTGYFFQTINTSVSSLINTESAFVSYYNDTSTSGAMYLVLYLDNHWQDNLGTIGLAVLHLTVTVSKSITTGNTTDPESYISVNTSGSVVNNMISAYPDPIDHGFSSVVKESIINAINEQSMPFDDILQVLEGIRTQDQNNYTTVITYLSDNDTFNSTLYTWLTTILEDDFSALLDDTTYISAVLNAARNLVSNMNSRDNTWYPIFDTSIQLVAAKLQTLIDLQNAAASQANQVETAAAGLEQQIQAANNYSQPDVEFMLTQADSIWVNGQSGVNLIATIINEPWIVQILLTVISLAFVGYLLYGKGV